MFYRLGSPEVPWYWMSDSGAGSLGGDSGAGQGSDSAAGDPGSTGEGGVDTSGSGGEEAGGEGAAAGQQPTPPAAPKEADWRDKRISTLTRRLKEMQERGQQQPPPPAVPTGSLTQADVDRLAESRARELAVIHDFNRRCDEVALAGRRTFGEQVFNGQVANLQKIVDQDDPTSVQNYNSFLMAAIETGEGPKLLHMMGSDLDEAQRIMGLPPTRMAVELTKKAMAQGDQVSGAPRPLTPVGGRGATHEQIQPDDAERADHLATADWMRRRETQLAERAKARQQR